MNKLDRILAFRSITSLAAIIQQHPYNHFSNPSSNVTEQIDQHPNKRRHLIISVAFSILAALEYEVVAVVAKMMRGEEMQVIVCSNLSSDKERPFLQMLWDTIKGIPRFLFTENHRPSDKDKKNLYPTIIPISRPADLSENNTLEELRVYVDNLW